MGLKQNLSYPQTQGSRFALQLVAVQIVVTLALSILGFCFSGLEISKHVAVAILCGGMICALANVWLALVVFRPALGKPPAQMLTAFYVGEVGKFIITAVLFLIAFKTSTLLKQPFYALLMFAAYMLVQCTAWAYPLARSKFTARQRR